MLMLIGIVLGIYWIIRTFGENAGAWAVGIVGLLLLVGFCKAWRDDSKAYCNLVKYWKNGGPERT